MLQNNWDKTGCFPVCPSVETGQDSGNVRRVNCYFCKSFFLPAQACTPCDPPCFMRFISHGRTSHLFGYPVLQLQAGNKNSLLGYHTWPVSSIPLGGSLQSIWPRLKFIADLADSNNRCPIGEVSKQRAIPPTSHIATSWNRLLRHYKLFQDFHLEAGRQAGRQDFQALLQLSHLENWWASNRAGR